MSLHSLLTCSSHVPLRRNSKVELRLSTTSSSDANNGQLRSNTSTVAMSPTSPMLIPPRPSNSTNGLLRPSQSPVNGIGNNRNIVKTERMNSHCESKIVVLGCPAVGKSAIVVRFLTNRFIWEYDPTLECSYRHHMLVDDEPVTMEILDTAGHVDDKYSHQENNIRWGDGFLLVYSLTDRQSMEEISRLYDHITSIRHGPNFSFAIVANKSDLEHMSQVSLEEAEIQASELGGALFVTSACDGGTSIADAFVEVHRDVVRRRWTRRRRSSAKQVMEVFNKMFTRINPS